MARKKATTTRTKTERPNQKKKTPSKKVKIQNVRTVDVASKGCILQCLTADEELNEGPLLLGLGADGRLYARPTYATLPKNKAEREDALAEDDERDRTAWEPVILVQALEKKGKEYVEHENLRFDLDDNED